MTEKVNENPAEKPIDAIKEISASFTTTGDTPEGRVAGFHRMLLEKTSKHFATTPDMSEKALRKGVKPIQKAIILAILSDDKELHDLAEKKLKINSLFLTDAEKEVPTEAQIHDYIESTSRLDRLVQSDQYKPPSKPRKTREKDDEGDESAAHDATLRKLARQKTLEEKYKATRPVQPAAPAEPRTISLPLLDLSGASRKAR